MATWDQGCRRNPARHSRSRSEVRLDSAATGAGMTPAYQPIVSLSDGAVVGFEALARWEGLAGCSPDRVFDHAYAIGTADVLDRACTESAIVTALRSGLTRGTLLCVNVEPATPYTRRADSASLAEGYDELTVMFEITERSPLAHPHSLLRKVAGLRSDGFSIALDDVGADSGSLALLDVILPEVIKLDLTLVQTQPSHAQARTLAAVLAHHERTGAVILAEGIETEEHLEQALAVGATLGQGYYFGRPGPLGQMATAPWSPTVSAQRSGPSTGSPFDLVAGTSPVRTARKLTLVALSRHIETQAEHAADPPMLFTALQHAQHFTGATRDLYRKLADSSPLVAVLGQQMPEDLESGVRCVVLDPTDPLCTEWTVVALGPHHAAALIARERADERAETGHHGDRKFDFVVTYDRSVVTAAARNLLDRMR